MAIIPEETRYTSSGMKSLSQRIREAERATELAKMMSSSEEGEAPARFPRRWMSMFRKSTKKQNREKALVLYFNKKNEIEEPKLMPIYDGNMIVWKHKVYRFDPRAMWLMKFGPKLVRVYCIREIDRRPIRNPETGKTIYFAGGAISNQDAEEVVASGNSTDSDELLIKAFLKAQTKETKMQVNWVIIGVIILVLIVGGFFLVKNMNF